MKNTLRALFVTLSAVIFSACSFAPSSSSSKSLSTSSSSSSSSSTETSKSDSTSSTDPLEAGETFHFYSINDFHGSIRETSGTYYEGGISKVFGKIHALKEQAPANSFVFSCGDMWQGSLESNSNYGAAITEAMNRDFDAGCLGNHDFDYGQDHLEDNINLAEFPLLAGNIYKWNDGKSGVHWDKTIASTIINRGGLKLGVVGMIGENQTTSITSTMVDDLYFENPQVDAIEEAKSLKALGCQAVVLLLHDPTSTFSYWNYDSGKNLKSYFDGIFCGHNHSNEKSIKDGVPLLEAACNGEGIAHFSLTYDGESFSCGTYEIISSSKYWNEDEEINGIINKYTGTKEFQDKANEVLFTSKSFLSKAGTIPNICCKSIFEAVKDDYPSVILAIDNGKRANIYAGTITYSDFYKAAPFMNKIVILHARGSDIKDEARSNASYTDDPITYATLNDTSYYDIAVIDYLSEHKNANKKYDYFYDRNYGTSYPLGVVDKYPVDCVAEYMKTLTEPIWASDFSGTENGYNLY